MFDDFDELYNRYFGNNDDNDGDDKFDEIREFVNNLNINDMTGKNDSEEDTNVSEATRLYYRSLLKLFFPYQLNF